MEVVAVSLPINPRFVPWLLVFVFHDRPHLGIDHCQQLLELRPEQVLRWLRTRVVSVATLTKSATPPGPRTVH